MAETYELGGIVPYVMNYAEEQITVYTVTGTLEKPVYTEIQAT